MHAYYLLTAGVHAYGRAPIAVQVLFHALLVFDALVVVLVVRASPTGPPLAAAVMLADTGANWWTQAGDVMRHPLHYLVPIGLLPITVFGVFVLLTAKPLRRTMTESRSAAVRASEQIV